MFGKTNARSVLTAVIPLTLVFALPALATLAAAAVPFSTDVRNPHPAVAWQDMGGAGQSTLLFSDDFDGTSLNEGRWNPHYWWRDAHDGCSIVPNGEYQWYQPDDVLVSNGMLRLRAQKRSVTTAEGKVYNYTSGVVTTGRECWADPVPDRFAFQYGYAEIRARVPKGKALWPAFWLMACDQRWPPEIDVLEMDGAHVNTNTMTVHYARADGSHGSSGGEWSGPDFTADWHTFGLDWRADALVWYIDGVERRRYTNATYIPHEPMYLTLNLAIGGNWLGAPDASTPFPSYFEVDYVKVWSAVPVPEFTPQAWSFLPLVSK